MSQTPTLDLDAHLAECRDRMQRFVGDLLAGVRAGDAVTNTDGMPMVVNHGTWAPGTDVGAILAREAVADEVTLTEDGLDAVRSSWHDGEADIEDYVRYEVYSAEGMIAHGYVHRASRRLVQVG